MVVVRNLTLDDFEAFYPISHAGHSDPERKVRVQREYAAMLAYPATIAKAVFAGPNATMIGLGIAAIVPLQWGREVVKREPFAITRIFLPDSDEYQSLVSASREAPTEYALAIMDLSYSGEHDSQAEWLSRAKTLNSFSSEIEGIPLRFVFTQTWNDHSRQDLLRSGFVLNDPDRLPTYAHVELRSDGSRIDTSVLRLLTTPDPILELTELEKRTVAAAIAGVSDAEIARQESVTEVAVRKRWESITAKCLTYGYCASQPQLKAIRGKERRRSLLDVLRQNPQEWRTVPLIV